MEPGLFQVARGHFCGPTALAAITGESAGDMGAAIKARRKHNRPGMVVGSHWSELVPVLAANGYTVKLKRLPSRKPLPLIRLAGWLDHTATYLVETRTHFMVVRDGLVVDNHTPKGRVIDSHPNRRLRVQRIAVVTKVR